MAKSKMSVYQAVGTYVAAIAAFYVGRPDLGWALIASTTAQGILIATTPGADRGGRGGESPSYGFTQWRNPVKGDAPVQVAYSTTGHKVAPVYVAATLTPKGEVALDQPKALRRDGQAMSALLCVGEGPIRAITDVRVNDEPLLEEFTRTFKGDGSKKTFRLSKKRIEVSTLSIDDGGTDRGYTLEDLTFTRLLGTGDIITHSFEVGEALATEYSPVITINGVELDDTATTGLRPRLWLETDRRMWLHSQTPVPIGTTIEVSAKMRRLNGVTVKKDDGEVILKFTTAPASGDTITVTGLRRVFRGIQVEKRLGGVHQLNIPGFNELRNTYGDGTEIGKDGNEVTITTRDEVDDVVLNISSGFGGFTNFGRLGDRNRTWAQFRIDYRAADANGAFTGKWLQMHDPAGTKTGNPLGKNATEFEVRGDSISQLFWSFSVRNLLRRMAEDHPNAIKHQLRLSEFTRQRYQVRITRTSAIKGNSNTNWLDDLLLSSYEEVIDEFLNYPGTAMLGIHAIASNRLQGGAPQITCNVKGIRDVKKWNGTAWVADPDAQGNPVWAAIDLVTNARYGGGEHYTLANIDTTSALAAANYCDANETLPGGETEARAVLSVPLDVRRGLLMTAAEMLRPAAIWPVLQGDTWKFVIDQSVDLTTVPVLWEDTADRRTTDAQFAHGSIAQQPTEIQASFLDEDKDHDSKEVWVTPGVPADSRRIQRIQAFGATRRTQVTRYANRVYTQTTAGGLSLRFRGTMKYLGMEAGDVFRYRSTRQGIDGYWRIFRLAFDSSDYFVKVEAIPYVLAVYGQQEAPQSTDTSSAIPRSIPTIPALVSSPRSPNPPNGDQLKKKNRRKMPMSARRLS